MGADSKIEWTDYTFNPWIGCSKVSAGCANCYAERDFDIRRGRAKWGPTGTRSKTSEANWKLPLQWNRKAGRRYLCERCGGTGEQVEGCYNWRTNRYDAPGGRCDLCKGDGYLGLINRRSRVFCASLADVFEEWSGAIVDHHGLQLSRAEDGRITTDVDWTEPLTMDDLRRDLFELIDATPHLDWLLVTKRPENIRRMWPRRNVEDAAAAWGGDGGRNAGLYRPNVWLLTSVEDQQTADARVPELLKCRDLSAVLGLSCEPLLGPINLHPWTCRSGGTDRPSQRWCDGICEPSGSIDWVIASGESGPGARPMHPDWARSLRDQCITGGVPFFFKQWGEYAAWGNSPSMKRRQPLGSYHDWPDGTTSLRLGKQLAGRLLDGTEHNEYPEAKQ